jgi:hypothetical protein
MSSLLELRGRSGQTLTFSISQTVISEKEAVEFSPNQTPKLVLSRRAG